MRVNSAAEDPCVFLPALPSPSTGCPVALVSGGICTPGVTDVLLTKVPGLPQSIEIDQRLNKNFRQGFLCWAPAAAQGVRTSDRFQCWLLPRGQSLFLFGGRGQVCRGLARGAA